VLELAILGLLKQRPMHGYDLRKRLRDDFGPMSNLSFGSLYPALARLEASGAVHAIAPAATRALPEGDAEPPGFAMTGSLTGERAALMARRATAKAAAALGSRSTRSRKVYEITSDGELLFERLLEEPDGRGEEARSFSLRLAFARHLTPQARIRLLERRRMQLSDRLQSTRRGLEAPGRTLDCYERAIAEHARESLESDLVWIERLLSAEHVALDAARSAERDDVTRAEQPAREAAVAAAGSAGAFPAPAASTSTGSQSSSAVGRSSS
jgi:DNA-binding PadR family transcriptional regulator